jgi:drug/metabolite transporter (DMT)-like permease
VDVPLASGIAVSKFTNRLFILLIVVTNTIGNILLGTGMQRMPDFQGMPVMSYTADLLTNWYVVGGTILLIIWMIAQLSMFTWADLTYVLPVTASAYILTALLSKYFLGERISIARWIGIVIISFGVVLVSETPEDTKHNKEPRR